jgi:hypothetical protein
MPDIEDIGMGAAAVGLGVGAAAVKHGGKFAGHAHFVPADIPVDDPSPTVERADERADQPDPST